MLQMKEKAEIRACLFHVRRRRLTLLPRAEALSSFGFQYLSEIFLPLKLQEAGGHRPLNVAARLCASDALHAARRATGSEELSARE